MQPTSVPDIMATPQSPPLPRAHFLGLPLEIREMIYEELLVLKTPCWRLSLAPTFPIKDTDYVCDKRYPERHFLALLYTNTQIYAEAKPIFLSKNTLRLGIETEPLQGRVLDNFTEGIGPENAGLLRHMDMFLPFTGKNQDGDLEITFDSLWAFHILKKRCPSLTTLRFQDGSNSREIFDFYWRNSSLVREILSEVNRLIRGMPSMKKITVYTGGALEPALTEFLQGLGWVVMARAYEWPE